MFIKKYTLPVILLILITFSLTSCIKMSNNQNQNEEQSTYGIDDIEAIGNVALKFIDKFLDGENDLKKSYYLLNELNQNMDDIYFNNKQAFVQNDNLSSIRNDIALAYLMLKSEYNGETSLPYLTQNYTIDGIQKLRNNLAESLEALKNSESK